MTHECFEDNEIVCSVCLNEDEDEDYVPNSDDEGYDTASDETGSEAGSDTTTDDDE
jgi:hypothetical protein